ncbi:MAG: acyltransferase [Pseudomonadota bacterium]
MPFRRIRIGCGAMIGHDVHFQTSRTSRITIGDRVSLNTGCHLVASEAISIGDNVAVGEYVSIRDQEHKFMPGTGVRDQGFKIAAIKIGANVWIGRGAYIGPGSDIGPGSIIAANSVVRGVFPEHVLIAGAPATARRKILPDGKTMAIASEAMLDHVSGQTNARNSNIAATGNERSGVE